MSAFDVTIDHVIVDQREVMDEFDGNATGDSEGAISTDRLGDDTAWKLGRVSFNPLRHIDPFGTLLLPGMLLLSNAPFLFGYAKPVPVNFRALHNPRTGMVLVALAGPATAMVLTTRDQMVAPAKQRELAQASGAQVFEVDIDHLEVSDRADAYNPALLAAVAAVAAPQGVPVG